LTSALGRRATTRVGFGFGFGALVARRQSRFDAFGHYQLGLFDERLDHLVLLHDAHDLALDEEVTALLAAAIPRSACRASPGPLTTQPITRLGSAGSMPATPFGLRWRL